MSLHPRRHPLLGGYSVCIYGEVFGLSRNDLERLVREAGGAVIGLDDVPKTPGKAVIVCDGEFSYYVHYYFCAYVFSFMNTNMLNQYLIRMPPPPSSPRAESNSEIDLKAISAVTRIKPVDKFWLLDSIADFRVQPEVQYVLFDIPSAPNESTEVFPVHPPSIQSTRTSNSQTELF